MRLGLDVCLSLSIFLKLRERGKGKERGFVGSGSCIERRSDDDADAWDVVSPLDLLKNPMILIAVVGLGFVFGMPYLMDSSMFPFFCHGPLLLR